MENTNENQNVKTMIENGILQLTIFEGTAPEQFNPKPVDISGTITAPAIFLDRREGEFEAKKAHCMASLTDGTISLVVNEQSVVDKYTVKGIISIGKRFKELGINTDTAYSPTQLSQKFRLLRSIFESNAEHLKITTLLRSLKAKINREIEQNDDNRGNTGAIFKQTVESNIPESFQLNLPLLEGEEPTTIDVSVILEAKNSDILCYLESVDAAEIIDNTRTKLVKEEVEKIDKVVAVFYH